MVIALELGQLPRCSSNGFSILQFHPLCSVGIASVVARSLLSIVNSSQLSLTCEVKRNGSKCF
jgi:hypothetical protein